MPTLEQVTSGGVALTSGGEDVTVTEHSYHSLRTDPSLVAHWSGDADRDGTGDANDASGNGNDGTWTGTPAYGVDQRGEPCFSFDGTNHIEAPVAEDPVAYSMLLRVKPSTLQVSSPLFRGVAAENNQASHMVFIDSNGKWNAYIYDGSETPGVPGAAADTNWTALASTAKNGGNLTWYLDGAEVGPVGPIDTLWTGGDRWKIGAAGSLSPSNINAFEGLVADVWILHRQLSDAEIAAYTLGPEPTYTSGSSINSSGNYDAGTWDDWDNGTVTYEHRLVDSAGTVLETVSSTASTTGTFSTTPTSEGNGTYYYEARATNDGGYDIGDSPVGGSSEGWYRLASVEVSGTSVPVFMHHYRQMATR